MRKVYVVQGIVTFQKEKIKINGRIVKRKPFGQNEAKIAIMRGNFRLFSKK